MKGLAVFVTSAALVLQNQQPASAACEGELCSLSSSNSSKASVPVIPYGTAPSEQQLRQMRLLQQQHALQHQAFLEQMRLQDLLELPQTAATSSATAKKDDAMTKNSLYDILRGHPASEQGEGKPPTLSIREYEELLGKRLRGSREVAAVTPLTTTTTTTTTTTILTTARVSGFTSTTTRRTTEQVVATTVPYRATTTPVTAAAIPALADENEFPPKQRKGLLQVPSLATLLGMGSTTTTTPAPEEAPNSPVAAAAESSAGSPEETPPSTSSAPPPPIAAEEHPESSESPPGKGFLASLFSSKPHTQDIPEPAPRNNLSDTRAPSASSLRDASPRVTAFSPGLTTASPIFGLQRVLGFSALPGKLLSASLSAFRREALSPQRKVTEAATGSRGEGEGGVIHDTPQVSAEDLPLHDEKRGQDKVQGKELGAEDKLQDEEELLEDEMQDDVQHRVQGEDDNGLHGGTDEVQDETKDEMQEVNDELQDHVESAAQGEAGEVHSEAEGEDNEAKNEVQAEVKDELQAEVADQVHDEVEKDGIDEDELDADEQNKGHLRQRQDLPEEQTPPQESENPVQES